MSQSNDQSAAEMIDIEIWVAWNEDGDAEAAPDEEQAIERLDENIGGYQRRMVKITVRVPKPATPEAVIEINEPPATVDVSTS